jgi:hypothetical protein
MQQPIVGGRQLCFERIFDYARAYLLLAVLSAV